jgi:hypothetical protein
MSVTRTDRLSLTFSASLIKVTYMFTRLNSFKENTETIKLHTNQTEAKEKKHYGAKKISVNKQGFKLSGIHRHAFVTKSHH